MILETTLAVCERAGFRPRKAQEATQLGTVVSLVAGGLGVALLPASIQNFQRKGAVYRRLAPPVARIPLAMAHRRGERSPIIQSFLATAREAAQEMNASAHRAG
jgi:DNA-binding transcriptional LysR family regulator